MLLTLASTPLAAQPGDDFAYSPEYGKVTTEELRQNAYPLDQSAEAVVIFAHGDYGFERWQERIFENTTRSGLELVMEVTRKIKIYDTKGVSFASVEIPFYDTQSNPEIVTIEGATYNLEVGEVVRTALSKDDITTEQVSGSYHVKRAVLPDVRPGSIVEFRYTIRTRNLFRMREWFFQETIPVWESRLAYRATPFRNYAFIVRGFKELDEMTSATLPTPRQFGHQTYNEVETVFAMRRMPAFRDEEFMPNTSDYISSIKFQVSNYMSFISGKDVQVMTTWPALCDNLLKDEDFGDYMGDAVTAAKKILPTLGLEGKDELAKFEAIVEYVKSNYTWNNYYAKYAYKKISDFLKDRSGNSADINLFTVGLLRAAGLEAHPVVLSTHANGWIYKSYPFIDSFDEVAAMVTIGGRDYFADASDPLTRYDEMPRRSTNVEGLVVRKKDPVWTPIRQNMESMNLVNVDLSVLPAEGKLHAQMTQTLHGHAAWLRRNASEGDVERLRRNYTGSRRVITHLGMENYGETAQPLVIDLDYDVDLWTPAEGAEEPARVYFNPLLYIAPSRNLFRQEQRTYPVDMIFATRDNYRVRIAIPEGYTVEKLPDEFTRSGDIMDITYRALIEGDTITLTAGFSMKGSYSAEQYPALKAMYEEMVEAFAQNIVFRKI